MREHRLVDQLRVLLDFYQTGYLDQSDLVEMYDPYDALLQADECLTGYDEELRALLSEGEPDPLYALWLPEVEKELKQLEETDWGPGETPSEEYQELAASIMNKVLILLKL